MNIFGYEQDLETKIKTWSYDEVFNYVEGLWEMFAELSGEGIRPQGLQGHNYQVAQQELVERENNMGWK